MPITVGFYDAGKIGHALIHAIIKDAPADFNGITYIKPSYQKTDNKIIFKTSTLNNFFSNNKNIETDLNAFVEVSDIILLCGRAQYGHQAVADIITTKPWQKSKHKKIINVSKGLWVDNSGISNLPSLHYPELYNSGRMAMLSGLSFHSTLLNNYPVRMALSCKTSCNELIEYLCRGQRLQIKYDPYVRAAELYGAMKNPLAIAAGYFSNDDLPVSIGLLAQCEIDSIANTFYKNALFSPCYSVDDVWGSMTPLSRNFRYGQYLRKYGENASNEYKSTEKTTSLPEGVSGSKNWISYQTINHNMPKTPLMQAVSNICHTKCDTLSIMQAGLQAWQSQTSLP